MKTHVIDVWTLGAWKRLLIDAGGATHRKRYGKPSKNYNFCWLSKLSQATWTPPFRGLGPFSYLLLGV